MNLILFVIHSNITKIMIEPIWIVTNQLFEKLPHMSFGDFNTYQ